MSQAQYSIELEWKSFNIDLNTVETWMRANAGEHYCGNQAGDKLTLWFLQEPDQTEKDAISTYWEALDEESDEAANYMSAEDREADKATKKESAKAKLAALGLTAEEIAAIVG